jgi:hypothetical protein
MILNFAKLRIVTAAKTGESLFFEPIDYGITDTAWSHTQASYPPVQWSEMQRLKSDLGPASRVPPIPPKKKRTRGKIGTNKKRAVEVVDDVPNLEVVPKAKGAKKGKAGEVFRRPIAKALALLRQQTTVSNPKQ